MSDLVADHFESCMIPFASSINHATWCRVQCVVGTSRGEGVFTVFVLCIIKDLHFRRGQKYVAFRLVSAKENATVAARLNFPLKLQLEIGVLLFGNQITGSAYSHQLTADCLPAFHRFIAPISAPAGGRCTVKEGAPSRWLRFYRLRFGCRHRSRDNTRDGYPE